jgi:hypothetical protein
MATQVQFRGGSTAEHSTFTGAAREVTVDITKDTVVVHDGATAGGHALAKEDGSTLTNVDINSGTIDGATIDTSNITVGSGKTLDVSGGTLTLADNQISGDKIEGGTIGSVTITSADINGGFIDGTVIGGATPAAGTFTALTSNGIDDNASATAMTLDASGNVGIGTGSPTGGNAVVTIENVNGTGAQINFKNAAATDGYIGLSGDANGDLIHYLGATADQIFSTAGTERMRIDSSGNVGIGTSSPDKPLEVVATNTAMKISGAGVSSTGLLFETNGVERKQIGIPSGSSDLAFYSDAGSTEAMRIDSSGNVGIGTSPSTALHVSTPVTTKSVVETTGASSDALIEFTRGQGSGNTWSVGLDQSNSSALSFAYLANGSPSLTSHNKMTIDASGNVGIGTSSPAGQNASANALVVENAAGNGGITIKTPTSAYGSLHFSDGTGLDAYRGILSYNHSDNSMHFYTDASERMRIDSSGSLLVGKTVANTTTEGVWLDGPNGRLFVTADDDYCAQFTRNGSDGPLIYLYNDTAQAGLISVSGSSTTYGTSSDYRLKTDAQPMTGASARVQALNPVNFEWIASGDRVDGFLAHEAQEVVPEAVTGAKDAMRDEGYEVTPAVYEDVVIPAVLDEEGNELEAERTEHRLVSEAVMGTRSVPDYQSIDQSKLVPLLTAALQEALTEIADLKVRITALEG